MGMLAAVLGLLAWVAPQAAALSGDQKVKNKESWFYKAPSRVEGTHRQAEDGEDVTVVSVEGRYAKVAVKKDGITAYIFADSLIPKERFKRSAADEAEGKRLIAQGQEGQRGINPETEREWRSQGGAAVDRSYQQLDGLMARPPYKANRGTLEDKLKEFRQVGKLGEFAAVK